MKTSKSLHDSHDALGFLLLVLAVAVSILAIAISAFAIAFSISVFAVAIAFSVFAVAFSVFAIPFSMPAVAVAFSVFAVAVASFMSAVAIAFSIPTLTLSLPLLALAPSLLAFTLLSLLALAIFSSTLAFTLLLSLAATTSLLALAFTLLATTLTLSFLATTLTLSFLATTFTLLLLQFLLILLHNVRTVSRNDSHTNRRTTHDNPHPHSHGLVTQISQCEQACLCMSNIPHAHIRVVHDDVRIATRELPFIHKRDDRIRGYQTQLKRTVETSQARKLPTTQGTHPFLQTKIGNDNLRSTHLVELVTKADHALLLLLNQLMALFASLFLLFLL